MIQIKDLMQSDAGRLVIYDSGHGNEKGVIKSWNDKFIFVVYKWEGDFRKYTAAATRPEDLSWI